MLTPASWRANAVNVIPNGFVPWNEPSTLGAWPMIPKGFGPVQKPSLHAVAKEKQISFGVLVPSPLAYRWTPVTGRGSLSPLVLERECLELSLPGGCRAKSPLSSRAEKEPLSLAVGSLDSEKFSLRFILVVLRMGLTPQDKRRPAKVLFSWEKSHVIE